MGPAPSRVKVDRCQRSRRLDQVAALGGVRIYWTIAPASPDPTSTTIRIRCSTRARPELSTQAVLLPLLAPVESQDSSMSQNRIRTPPVAKAKMLSNSASASSVVTDALANS